MLTAWDVYWVMQLDSISSGIGTIAGVGILLAAVLSVWNGVSNFDTAQFPSLCDKDARRAACGARAKTRNRIAATALPLYLLAAFIPSTKTAAAMVVVPAIVNNQTLQNEAGELYDLAKRALSEAVGEKEK